MFLIETSSTNMARYLELQGGQKFILPDENQQQAIDEITSNFNDNPIASNFTTEGNYKVSDSYGYKPYALGTYKMPPPGPANPYMIGGSSPARVEEERQRFIAAGGDPNRVVTTVRPIVQPDGTVTRPISDTAPFPGQQVPQQQQTQQVQQNVAQPIPALPPSAPLPSFGQSNLTIGSRGEEVRQLQSFLLSKGINPGPLDGIFGPLTQSAVKQYQQMSGLNPDGIVGSNTKSSIGGTTQPQTPVLGAPGASGGVSGGSTGTNASPTPQAPIAPPVNTTSQFESIYNEALATNGVSERKNEINSISDEIEKIDAELTDQIQTIQDNPWDSEALKSKKIIKLQDKYEKKKQTKTAVLTLLQGELDRAYADAKFRTTGEVEEVNKALDRAEKERDAMLNLTKTNPANYKEVQGGLYNVETGEWVVSPKPSSGTSDLTPAQTQNFLRISDKFQADEVIKNANKGSVTIAIADQVIANPSSAANQLKSLYTLVKNLDPDSAVREGEVALAQLTQSYLQNWQTALTRITTGQVINPDTAVALANATKDLANAWFSSAKRRETQYKSQSNIAGIGDAFNAYLMGFERPYNNPVSSVVTPQDKTEALNQIVGENTQKVNQIVESGKNQSIPQGSQQGFLDRFAEIFGF